MAGSESHHTRRVIVVGGGVAGLAAAHRFVELAREQQHDLSITLLEARDRLGGSVVTVRRNGFLIEGGPDSFITQKPWAIALCKRIGIADQVIGTNPDCRRVYVVHKGRLYPIPEGFLLLAPTRIWPFLTRGLFTWSGKIRMAMDVVLPARKRAPGQDESLADFVLRRFGREALERIAQPLVGGIYTADPQTLSLRATMPRFLELEDRYRSVILGMRRMRQEMEGPVRGGSGARYGMFVSFRDGMATLTDRLASLLPTGGVRTNAAVLRIERAGRRWHVLIEDGTVETADAVVLTCPAYTSEMILSGLDRTLAAELSAIDYASSATMTLGFHRRQIRHDLDGFGFVVPLAERRSMIAGTFGSIKFPGRAPPDRVLMRAFLGGAVQPEIYEMDDGRLTEAVLRDLRDLVGATGEPLWTDIYRWPRSMPQYPVGHLDRVARIERLLAAHPGLALAGNAFGGVGIPDCVHSGEAAAERLWHQILAV